MKKRVRKSKKVHEGIGDKVSEGRGNKINEGRGRDVNTPGKRKKY